MEGIIAVLAMSAISFNAQAGNINYNYVDLSYASANVSGAGSGSGFAGAFSASVSDNLSIVGVYDTASIVGVSLSDLQIGVEYHQQSSDTSDWYADLKYRSTNIGGISPTGFMTTIGVRVAASKKGEFKAGIGYSTITVFGATFSGMIFDIGGVYNVSDNIGITLNYFSDTDSFGWTITKVGVRYAF